MKTFGKYVTNQFGNTHKGDGDFKRGFYWDKGEKIKIMLAIIDKIGFNKH